MGPKHLVRHVYFDLRIELWELRTKRQNYTFCSQCALFMYNQCAKQFIQLPEVLTEVTETFSRNPRDNVSRFLLALLVFNFSPSNMTSHRLTKLQKMFKQHAV